MDACCFLSSEQYYSSQDTYARYKILSNHFWHQTTGNFDKLIEQDSKKNTTKIANLSFLVIKMHIEPTKLLENSSATINYDLEGKLCKKSWDLDLGDNKKIEEAVTTAKDNKDKAKSFLKKK